ncbi:MAG TPA: ATP-binding protein [Geothrix sp.]|jgi:PAS domain S-box-containing protein
MDTDRRLHDILGCITDGVVRLDASWHYTYVNPRAAAMFGRKPEDLLGRHIWTEFPEGLGQPFHLAYERAMREQRVITFNDYYAPWDRWFENRVYPSPEGLTILFQDITEAYRRDKALRQAQKLESLGLLASGIAHDFNNLLGALVAHLNLLELSLPPDSPHRRRTDGMGAVLARATDLVRQMLAYAGQGESSPRHLDPNHAIHDIAGLMAVSAPKGVDLHLALDQDAPWITADPAQFQQVVLNLLTNAADAIESGNGQIRIATRKEILDEASLSRDFQHQELAAGDFLCLEVADSGCGMTEEVISRIFDPFFTTKTEGRGLGLTAMRGILRGHGGGMAIQSRPGQGTTFRIYFPISDRPQPLPPASGGEALPPLRVAGSALVVDDEASLRAAVVEYLQLQGLMVLEAADGIEALETLMSRDDLALVVMDLTMPRMSGLEALAALRRTHPRLPVVLVSGYTADPGLRDLQLDAATSFLAKPFDFRALHRHIAELVLAEP